MSVVAEVVARLRADSSNLVAGFNQADRASRRLTTSTDTTRRGLAAAGNQARRTGAMTQAASSQMTSSINTSTQSMGRMRQMTGGLTRGFGMMGSVMGAVGFAGVTAGLVAMGSAAVKGASDMEQNRVAFTTMLGSAKKADAMLADMRKFAAATPFELPQLITGTKRLLAFGFQASKIKPMLTAIGDAASGLGIGGEGIDRLTMALGQMKAKGKVQGDELLQLSSAGVPALQYLADAYKTTTGAMQEMITKGSVPADKAIAIITRSLEKGSAHAKGFGGMMAAQAKTTEGVWSTFKDTVNNALTDAMTPVMPKINKVLTAMTPMVGGAIKGVVTVISGVASAIKRIVAPIAGPLVSTFRTIGQSLGLISTPAKALNPLANTMQNMAAGAGKVTPPVTAVSKAVHSLTASFSKGGSGAVAFSKTFASIKTFVAALMPTIKQLAAQFMATLLPGLRDIGKILTDQFLPAFRRILPVITPVAKFLLKMFGSAVIGALKGAMDVIKGVLVTISGIFNVFASLVKGDWSGVWNGLKQIASGVMTAIWGAIQVWWNVGIINVFRKGIMFLTRDLWVGMWSSLKSLAEAGTGALKSGLGKVGEILLSPFKRGFAAVKSTVTTAWNYIRGSFGHGVGGIRGVLARLIEVITYPYRQAFNVAKNIITGNWSAIGRMFRTGVSKVGTAMARVKTVILNAVKGAGKWLLSVGKDVVGGMAQGIKDSAHAVLDAVTGLVNKIPKKVRKLLHIASPSKVMKALFKWVPLGMAEGIKVAGFAPVQAAEKVVRNVVVTFERGLKGATKAAREGGSKALSTFKDKMKAVLDYRATIADQMKEFGSLFSFTQDDSKPLTAADLIGNMQDKIAQIKKFAAEVNRLRKLHLRKDLLKQIIDAGPDAGGKVAQAILGGGMGAIKSLNHAQMQLIKSANRVGDVGTLAQFGLSGAQANAGLHTSITVANGAVRIHFGGEVTAHQRAELARLVKAQIHAAMKELAKELRRKKKG